MDLERWLGSHKTRREFVEGTVRTASGIYLTANIPNSWPYPEKSLSPEDFNLVNLQFQFSPQGTLWDSPYWWTFDRDYAASIGQPWLFANGGPLDIYDYSHADFYGGPRTHLREKWLEYAQRNLKENPAAKIWMGLCHALQNAIYYEPQPQPGRHSVATKMGILCVWHAADIPIPMSTDPIAMRYVLEREGDWFVANIPRTAGSRWYHLITAISGNQLYGTNLGTVGYLSGLPVEAYRPYPLGPDKDINELSLGLQAIFYRTVHELYEKDSMDRRVVDYIISQ